MSQFEDVCAVSIENCFIPFTLVLVITASVIKTTPCSRRKKISQTISRCLKILKMAVLFQRNLLYAFYIASNDCGIRLYYVF